MGRYANLIRKESADVVIVIESLERKKTCLSSLQVASCRREIRRGDGSQSLLAQKIEDRMAYLSSKPLRHVSRDRSTLGPQEGGGVLYYRPP